MRTEEPPVYFGDWLKRRRQSLDLTQAELAERAGCSVFALRKIESGERRPSKQLAALVAGVLEIDGSELDAFVRAARGDIGSDRLPPLAPPEPFPIPVPIAASAPLGNWPAQLTPLVGRGLGALRQESDPRTLALGLNFISPAAIALGYHDEADASLRESLEICREQGDRWGMGTALRFLGLAALAQGDVVRAQDMLHRSLEVHQGFVVGWDIARTLTYLGNTELALGELDEARQYYEEAQQWAEDARSRPAALDALVGLAQVAALAGQTQQALALARMVLDDDASSQDARGVATRLCAVPAGQNR